MTTGGINIGERNTGGTAQNREFRSADGDLRRYFLQAAGVVQRTSRGLFSVDKSENQA